MSCIVVSVFMQYSYLSAYLWIVLAAHYIFRGITVGKLGHIHFYFYIGYGIPVIVVCVCLGVNVLLYGAGARCLGNQYHRFAAVYIGEFLFLCIVRNIFIFGIISKIYSILLALHAHTSDIVVQQRSQRR